MAITKRLKFQKIYEFCRMNWAFDPPKVAIHYTLIPLLYSCGRAQALVSWPSTPSPV